MSVLISIIFDPSRQKAREIYSLVNTAMMIKLFAKIFYKKFFSPLHCRNLREWFSPR